MKLQLDTKEKVIRLEESVNLGEFTETLKLLLPDGLWKEYRLETNCTIFWNNPIVIEPYRPYTWPWITYTDGTSLLECNGTATNKPTPYTLTSGVYNIQC